MTNTKKKQLALVFGITQDFVFALANTLLGLKKHNKPFWDDIIVLHDGISAEDQTALNKIYPIKFCDMADCDAFKNISSSQSKASLMKYSVATFYRYECLKLLNDYKKVIWNDVDILIRGDISSLVNYADRTGIAFSAALPHFSLASSLNKLILDYKMFVPLWNVGIMVLSDKLPKYNEAYRWCVEATVRYNKKLLWPDLAILNLMIQEFNYDVENIDGNKYVCLPLSEHAKDAAILHAYGDAKFWNRLCYMEKIPEWMDNAIEWGKMQHKAIATKNHKPKISCIMSCYERYDYLNEAVNSILAQSYADFELIVVLEKAKNQAKIEEILKSFKDPRIVIIKNTEKLGFSTSLNVGIDKAKGDFIARMDDDDVSIPQRFALELKEFEQKPTIQIVGSGIRIFGEHTGTVFVYPEYEDIKASTLIATPFMHPTVMIRKSFIDKNNLRYDPEYFTEDFELWSRAIYLGNASNLTQQMVFYRSHNQQATNSGTSNNELKMHNSHKKIMYNQLKKHLHLELSDNEIEVIQARKQYEVVDKEGFDKLRKRTIEKILEANQKYHTYNQKSLKEVLFGEKQVETIIEHKTPKDVARKIVKAVIWPVYGRLLDRVEKNVVMKHNAVLRYDMQWQIDRINEKINSPEDEIY